MKKIYKILMVPLVIATVALGWILAVTGRLDNDHLEKRKGD